MLAIWPGSSWSETIFTHLIHPLNPHLSQISIIKLCFDYTMKDLLSNYMVTPEPIFIHR